VKLKADDFPGFPSALLPVAVVQSNFRLADQTPGRTRRSPLRFPANPDRRQLDAPECACYATHFGSCAHPAERMYGEHRYKLLIRRGLATNAQHFKLLAARGEWGRDGDASGFHSFSRNGWAASFAAFLVGKSSAVADLVARYRAERMPSRYSTRRGYEVWIRLYVMPRFGDMPITDVQPREVELWLASLSMTPKSRAEVRAILSRLWDFAMWSGDVPVQRNPMSLVKIRGSSKRTRQPRSLIHEEFRRFLVQLREPFRTAALLCVSLGLRISECMAFKWGDVDWLASKLTIERGIVTGRIDDVKTPGSRRAMLLAPEIVVMLEVWQSATQFGASGDWIFASPAQLGRLPWSYPRTARVFRDAAAAAGLKPFGRHSLRHTYRSWLDSTGSSMAVQQRLMRHASIATTSIATTMIYGDVAADAMTVASRRIADVAFSGLRTDRKPS
jgi:integrase